MDLVLPVPIQPSVPPVFISLLGAAVSLLLRFGTHGPPAIIPRHGLPRLLPDSGAARLNIPGRYRLQIRLHHVCTCASFSHQLIFSHLRSKGSKFNVDDHLPNEMAMETELEEEEVLYW